MKGPVYHSYGHLPGQATPASKNPENSSRHIYIFVFCLTLKGFVEEELLISAAWVHDVA